MSEGTLTKPLDLSTFDQSPDSLATAQALVPQAQSVQLPVSTSTGKLDPEPAPPRLVEVANLSPEDLAAAQKSADRIDFRKTATLLAHGDNVLAEIAQSSRQLLTGVRLGDSGEVGQIAAAVLDGIKILRIQDLQSESADNKNAVA